MAPLPFDLAINATCVAAASNGPMAFMHEEWFMNFAIPSFAIPATTWFMWAAETIWTDKPRGFKRNTIRAWVSRIPFIKLKPKHYMEYPGTIRIDAMGNNVDALERIKRHDERLRLTKLMKERERCATRSPSASSAARVSQPLASAREALLTLFPQRSKPMPRQGRRANIRIRRRRSHGRGLLAGVHILLVLCLGERQAVGYPAL